MISVIICTYRRPQMALRAIRSVLAPDGVLAIGMVEGDTDYLIREFLGVPVPLTAFPRDELEELLPRHGFTVIELAAGFGHFDWRDASPMIRIHTALLNAGLELGGISIPISDVPAALSAVAELGNPLVVAVADGC